MFIHLFVLLTIVIKSTVCSNPPKIENGIFIGPSEPRYGSVYRYECNSGFTLRKNSSEYLLCDENGKYSCDLGKSFPECYQCRLLFYFKF